MWSRGTGLMLAMAIVGVSARARADEAAVPQLRLQGTQLVVTTADGDTFAELACEGRRMVTRGDRVYVACGEDGVAVVDIAVPKRAHLVERLKVAGIAADVRVQDGRVEVREEERPPIVVRSKAKGPPAIFPVRVGNVVELSLGALLSASRSGGAVAPAVSAAYRFTLPIVVGISMDHGGFVYGARSLSGFGFNAIFDGSAFVGLDTRYVELGGSIGLAMPRGDPPVVGMIMGYARFGARDGLNLHVRAGFLYDTNEDHHSFGQWKVNLGVQIPVGSRWAFVLDGGGGAARDTVEVVMGGRHRLVGDLGDRGGIWLSLSAGLLYASLENDYDSLEYIGPAVKGTVDFRF